MSNTASVKFQSHFKLYVLFKDYILFEALLNKNEIDYYTEISENSFVSEGIRYFLLDSDRIKIDEILKKNDIIASTETIHVTDYRHEKKLIKFEFYVYLIITILVILLIISMDFFKS